MMLLHSVVREPSNEVTFEQRPEGTETANFLVVWKSLPARGSSSWCLATLRNSKCSWSGVNQWESGRI